jgi:hypothetical protein
MPPELCSQETRRMRRRTLMPPEVWLARDKATEEEVVDAD